MFRSRGCLVIHGFGGSTEEVRPIADFLIKRGFEIVCPELKGHTGRRRDLASVNYLEWIKSAEEGLRALQKKCADIYLIGFSMGGLIAANLAMKYKVRGVITLNMPIYPLDFKKISQNIAEDIKGGRSDSVKRYVTHTFNKPLKAYVNFKILLDRTKARLEKLCAPIFIIQALEDDTVHHKSAEFIYEKVSSATKEIKYYEGSGHLICYSRAVNNVFEDIGDFLERLIKSMAS